MVDDPLPLLRQADEYQYEEELFLIPAWYGYAMLGATWALFVVTVNSLFEVWRYIIQPLQGSEWHKTLTTVFEKLDYIVLTLWCLYVVAWWWAVLTWVGIKLFKHSKGSQT